MLGRLLSLFAALMLATAPASAYAPEPEIARPALLAEGLKTAPRGVEPKAEPAAKEKSAASVCRVWEIWSPPLKLASSIGYTGYYADAESGQYYAQQRYYRQGIGRFTRIDPWEGDTQRPITLNKYLYANGNPLIYVDPDGRAGRKWQSEEEIPEGVPYWAEYDGKERRYRSASPADYETELGYKVRRGTAEAMGWDERTKPLSTWTRVKRFVGWEGKPSNTPGWQSSSEQLVVKERPAGIDVDVEVAEIAATRRDSVGRAYLAGREVAEAGTAVSCGISALCSIQEAWQGESQGGKKLSGLDRGLAAAPFGLVALKGLKSVVTRLDDVAEGARASDSIVDVSPYVTRIDPTVPGRPHPMWSIDTSDFLEGASTARGGVRNAPEFWKRWLEMRPETISDSNRFLIEQLQRNPRAASPRIDQVWVRGFPEHAEFLELPSTQRVLFHHHVDQGRYAIPVPGPTHQGSGGPWHGFPLR